MFELGTPLWQIAVRALVVYAAVFLGLRLMGKRQLGQMTVFDLVVILLISNAVQNAMVGPDTSVQGGITAAFVLLALNFIVSRARLFNARWGRLVEGTPTLLVKDGKVIRQNLRREGLEPEEIDMAIREHGMERVSEVRVAYLEPDGSISVVPMSSPTFKGRRRFRQLKKQ